MRARRGILTMMLLPIVPFAAFGSGSEPSKGGADPAGTLPVLDKYDYWKGGGTLLRGFMISPWLKESDIEDMRQWGANLARLQIKAREHLGEDFAEVFPTRLDQCVEVVRWCGRRGIAVVIDYHYDATRGSNLWSDPAEHDRMVARWKQIAKRFRDVPNVIGYDLINEPIHPSFPPLQPWPESGVDSWPALARRIIRAIRGIDPRTPIVIEPGPSGGMPQGFRVFPALEDDRLVMSFHMYQPHAITYQGIPEDDGDPRPMPVYYPGNLDGRRIDKKWLAENMRPALEYSKAHDVPVFVGEFSCVRWAPGETAVRYLRDAVDLFEEYGWNWTYHAFREWTGWSLEHEGEPFKPVPATEPTDRALLIRSYFERNRPFPVRDNRPDSLDGR